GRSDCCAAWIELPHQGRRGRSHCEDRRVFGRSRARASQASGVSGLPTHPAHPADQAHPARASMRYIWLIPLLPGIGAAINGLVGIRSFSRKTAGAVAVTMMTAALALSLVAFWQLLGLEAEARAYDVNVADWIPQIPMATHERICPLHSTWAAPL